MSRAFDASSEQRYSVALMAGIGIPQAAIASALGITEPTLRKYFRDELSNGKVKTIAKVADSLVRQALAGNMTAAIFYLKTQGGWRESSAAAEAVGKKEQANITAVSAHKGTGWDGLLSSGPGPVQ